MHSVVKIATLAALATATNKDKVKALGQALPRDLVRLELRMGSLNSAALRQLASSQPPRIYHLHLAGLFVPPDAVLGYLAAAKAQRRGAGPAEALDVLVTSPLPAQPGLSEAAHRAAWGEAVRQAQRLAPEVMLEVEW